MLEIDQTLNWESEMLDRITGSSLWTILFSGLYKQISHYGWWFCHEAVKVTRFPRRFTNGISMFIWSFVKY